MNKPLKYEYVPHTADVKFRAYGKTREEAFANAAIAMLNVMVDTRKVKGKITKKIAAEGMDLQSLLQNFLEQFIILLDTDNFFLSKIKKIEIKKDRGGNKGTAAPLSTPGNVNYSLTAVAIGDEAKNYETIGPQVKACTYNSMLVKKQGTKWTVQVVVDI